MPFLVADNPYAAIQFVETRLDTEDSLRSKGGFFDELPIQLSSVSVGTTTYPLRKQFRGSYVRALKMLTINGVSPLITGIGGSSDAAVEDFSLKIHASIQDLINKRPFEMSDRDRLVWETLNEFVDTTVYRNTTPVSVRQFGCVTKARPYPDEVEWENGLSERVTVKDVADPDYINYKAGQPFEAVVLRDPLTFGLIRVVHIDRRRISRRPHPAQENQLLEEVGSAQSLDVDEAWKP